MTEKLVPGVLYKTLGRIRMIPGEPFWKKKVYKLQYGDFVWLERSEIIMYVEEIYKDYNPFAKMLYYKELLMMSPVYYNTQLLEKISKDG